MNASRVDGMIVSVSEVRPVEDRVASVMMSRGKDAQAHVMLVVQIIRSRVKIDQLW